MISISNQSHESSHVHGLHTSSEGMAKTTSSDGEPSAGEVFDHRTLVQRAAAFDGNLHLAEEIAWPKAQGDEVW